MALNQSEPCISPTWQLPARMAWFEQGKKPPLILWWMMFIFPTRCPASIFQHLLTFKHRRLTTHPNNWWPCRALLYSHKVSFEQIYKGLVFRRCSSSRSTPHDVRIGYLRGNSRCVYFGTLWIFYIRLPWISIQQSDLQIITEDDFDYHDSLWYYSLNYSDFSSKTTWTLLFFHTWVANNEYCFLNVLFSNVS